MVQRKGNWQHTHYSNIYLNVLCLFSHEENSIIYCNEMWRFNNIAHIRDLAHASMYSGKQKILQFKHLFRTKCNAFLYSKTPYQNSTLLDDNYNSYKCMLFYSLQSILHSVEWVPEPKDWTAYANFAGIVTSVIFVLI